MVVAEMIVVVCGGTGGGGGGGKAVLLQVMVVCCNSRGSGCGKVGMPCWDWCCEVMAVWKWTMVVATTADKRCQRE